jgi:putative membrane protein
LFLSRAEADAVDARIARVEARTGVQVVTAIVGRSDTYPEIPWKAFALGVATAALMIVVLDFTRPDWMTAYAAWSNATPILGIGAASALLALAVPAYARLFLNRIRGAGEVRQYAQAMFLDRQLFRTAGRNGILLLASLFERRVELLADIGFHSRIDESGWAAVIGAMTPLLARARSAEALLLGLDSLEELLAGNGFASKSPGDELSNRPIEESGA